MNGEIQKPSTEGLIEQVRAQTPARILVTRAGTSYATGTQLELRGDHAAALDAVRAELDIARDFDPEFVSEAQAVSGSDAGDDQARISVAAGFGAETE